MKAINYLFYCTAVLLVMASCTKGQESTQQDDALIEITEQQFETDAMQLGNLKIEEFESIVKCNGLIVPQPNGIARISAPVAGIVKNVHVQNGQKVDSRKALLEISGNEIIDLQRDFAEASANFSRSKNEFERSKLLFAEKVISEKEYVLVESEYKSTMAKYNGLKMKILSIGLSVTKIENGEFYSSYMIRTPINGTVSSLKANIGSYVDAQTDLLEVVDPTHLQVQLSVFASDMAQLKLGQSVRFKSTNTNELCYAKLQSIGVTVDSESRTIECHATILDQNAVKPIANSYVETEIITNIDSVRALPNDAIIKTETGYVVLVLQKKVKGSYYFNKTDIVPGRQSAGFTEVLTDLRNSKVLIKGAYNIQ